MMLLWTSHSLLLTTSVERSLLKSAPGSSNFKIIDRMSMKQSKFGGFMRVKIKPLKGLQNVRDDPAHM
eukprot:1154838-Pelagomonas_calceolata.AAC.1